MCERVGLLQCFDMIFRYQKVKNLFALEFREAQCGHIRIIDTPVRYGNEELKKHVVVALILFTFKTDPANEVEGEMIVEEEFEDTISQLGTLLLITTLLN